MVGLPPGQLSLYKACCVQLEKKPWLRIGPVRTDFPPGRLNGAAPVATKETTGASRARVVNVVAVETSSEADRDPRQSARAQDGRGPGAHAVSH